MDRMPRLGFDLDGVIANWGQVCVDIVNAKYGTHYTMDDWTDWSGGVIFEGRQDLLRELALNPNTYMDAAPVKGAIEALWQLWPLAEIYVVTCRPESCERATRLWMESNGIPTDHLFVCQDKPATVAPLNLDAYLDDKLEYAEALVPLVGKSFLFDTPYNRQPTNAIRVVGWDEALDKLLKVTMP